jgi:hypothetical protein
MWIALVFLWRIMKKIDTLISDMYDVFLKPHTINEENLKEFGENMKAAVVKAIKAASEKRIPTLRMSVIGKPDRQLWYELKAKDSTVVAEVGDVDVYEPNPEKYIKFLFGDIIEQLLVFLVKEAGHTVSHGQEELEIDGVLGHCDPVIDGVPADIKSASKYAFYNKFKLGGLLRGDDPFGYVGQLSGYRERLLELYPDEIDPERVAWLAMNKETGEICLLVADAMDLINAEDRIKHIKSFLEQDTPPEQKCYEDEPDGSNGNRVLHASCTYCPFKSDCWKEANDGQGLRAFKYSNGIKYLTHVEKLPRVEEITNAK